jgi:casein kinase II subunit beta
VPKLNVHRNPTNTTRQTQFISSRGNEYFCEIDEEYLTDRFNLTGLNIEVHYYQHALDLITDVFDLDCEDDMRETIEKSARHLYGLVHARYITTTRGLAKMVDKYKKYDFGRCPRVMCEGQPLLPCGLDDNPGKKPVKLYCARCEDLYNPKSSRHAAIDGAYFGTSFHNTIFQVYPALIPAKSHRRYEPRIFGFRVHAAASLGRWQDEERRDMRERLAEAGIGNVNVADAQGNIIGAAQQLYVEDEGDDDGMVSRAQIREEVDALLKRQQAGKEGDTEAPAPATPSAVAAGAGIARARALHAAMARLQSGSTLLTSETALGPTPVAATP